MIRNKSNIFPVDPGINQKRMENCINAPSALLQKFSILFSVDTWINWKNIIFHCLWTQRTIILSLLNAGLSLTFIVVEGTYDITIKFFGRRKSHLTFKPPEQALHHHSNRNYMILQSYKYMYIFYYCTVNALFCVLWLQLMQRVNSPPALTADPTGGGISQMAGESLRENPRGSYTSSRFHQQISGTYHGNGLYLYYESKSKHLVR